MLVIRYMNSLGRISPTSQAPVLNSNLLNGCVKQAWFVAEITSNCGAMSWVEFKALDGSLGSTCDSYFNHQSKGSSKSLMNSVQIPVTTDQFLVHIKCMP